MGFGLIHQDPNESSTFLLFLRVTEPIWQLVKKSFNISTKLVLHKFVLNFSLKVNKCKTRNA